MAGSKPPVYLVAGQAVYRVLWSDETTVLCKIEGGSSRVRDREVEWPRGQVEAAIALGEMRSTRTRPKFLDEIASQASKLDQEATLALSGEATGQKQRQIRKGKVRDRPGGGPDAGGDPTGGPAQNLGQGAADAD